jgi:hypothetical protein
LLKSWRNFDESKWFSEWEQYFRRIFNKLVTRQLFEEVQKTQESIDHYVVAMGNTFKEFPPYVNGILWIYPFNDKEIIAIDPAFHSDLEYIDLQISDLNAQYADTPEAAKEELRKKIKALKQTREQRRRQAYIAFLRTKDIALADIFAQLVTSKFDFSVLTADKQQFLIDALVKNTLEDTIKNKVPELLSVNEEDITQFVHDLFDLKKMNITIPTKTGPVPLSFLKKEFLASVRTQLPALNDLEDIQNLPLNFVTQLTESNAAFFEDSPIFDSIYTDFIAKNGKFRLNDAYKVRITKDGKVVEWYLSAYCPIEEYNANREERNGKELYLYSQPITQPSQERAYVNRPHEEGKSPIPVVIKDEDQQACDIEVLDKKINLNGEAFWALLFGYVLGQQSMNVSLSPEKEKELAAAFGKLNVYQEKEEWEEKDEPVSAVSNVPEHNKENSEREKFNNERKQLKWYDFTEKQYERNFGFVEWTRLCIPFKDSLVPPLQSWGKAWLQIEIVRIDQAKWTFKVKIRGGELGLGEFEWAPKELPITAESLLSIKKAFGDTIYKLPDTSKLWLEEQLTLLRWAGIKDLEKNFGSLKCENDGFVFALGDQKDKKVTHFGRYEPGIGEAYDQEPGNSVLYKVKYNHNNTVTVTGEVFDGKQRTKYPSRDMDYANFLILVKEKWLQPKTEEQAERMKKNVPWEDKEAPTTVRWFSINNVISFFKNWASKLKDGIKKYDEERAEDLTDVLTQQGQLWGKIWWLLSPFSRISSSFESMGAEHFLERDNRIWKKVEKRKKFYEDGDFSLIYGKYIEPMIKGKITITPHYKAAAMLLAMIAKGKWPYNRNPQFAEKGMWINILMWPEHQARYLDMREKKIRELEQNSVAYGSIWTDNKKDEIVELEMRYMVHTMDARQLGMWDDVKYFFYKKYSKNFVDELEKWYTWFFSQSTVEEWYGKVKSAPFEFARWEFFRLIWDRPQQAIPFLKAMATKAMSDSQWKAFEVAVMAWMLSWVFLNTTYSDTQEFIQKICRTRWFIPWIRVRNINQQTKLQRLLDIFSKGDFSKSTAYNPSNFSLRTISEDPRGFLKWDQNKPWKFQKWLHEHDNLTKLSNFLKLTGKNVENQTLLEIYSDQKTSQSDKLLINEFLQNGNEKDESLDKEVRENPSALTWSILTKSQSAVHQMLKIDQTWFAGQTWDEIQTMKWFFTDMSNAIPKHTLDSKEQVKFFIDKFFNRFDEKWFSWNNVTMFIKRLKRCKQNPQKKEIDDVLYYSIVWQIAESLGHGKIPIELENALVSWKDFFKNNLDTILQPDILVSSFWWTSYKQDFDKYQPKLEPRESCINLLDRDLKQTYFFSLSPDQKKQMNHKLQYLKSDKNYLNGPLYELAEKVERNFSIENRFKSDVDTKEIIAAKKPSSSPKATWARINNPEVIENVRRVLENKPLDEDNSDEYVPMEDYYNY